MTSKPWSHASFAVLAAALGATCAPNAWAADVEATAPSTIGQVEEVVVTARKREESDLAAPVSITALSAKQIERQAVMSVADIALRTPSLSVGSNTGIGGGSIYLRGIGTNAVVAGTLEQSVTLDIDGAPLARGNAIRIGQYDLGQIQILKGPQALFFGKNSPAGVIAFRSKDPTDEFEAMTKFSYEPYADNRFVDAAISGPITSTLRGRFFAHLSATDGEKDNISDRALAANAILPNAVVSNPSQHAWANKETFLRGTLIWEPTDTFKARLTSSYDRLSAEGTQAFPEISYCPTGKAQTQLVAAFLLGPDPFTPNFADPRLGPLSQALSVDDCKANGTISAGGINPANLTAPNVFSRNPRGLNRNITGIHTAELDYELTPQISLASVTTYARLENKDTDGFTWGPASVPLIIYNNYSVQSQFTQELRATTKFDGPFNLMVGGFYEDAHFDAYSQNVAIAPYTYMNYHIPNKVYSGFVQAIWNITPEIEFAAGVRETKEKKRLDLTRLGVLQPVANRNVTFNNTSPEITLSWRPSSTVTFYSAYKTGFKSGGYANTVTQANPDPLPPAPLQDFLFEPEKAKGFEAGAKAELLDRTLRVDITAYSYKYTNLQVSNYTVNNGVPVQEVLNAASARQQGIEVAATYYPPQVTGLQLTATANYNDSHYLDFISPCFAGQSIAEGCALLANPATAQFTSQDLSGRQFTNAPRWVGAAGFTYTHPMDGMHLEVGGDAAFKSAYNGSALLAPGGRQKSSAILSAQIRLIADDESWEFGVYGKNLADTYRAGDVGEVVLTGNPGVTGTAAGGILGRSDLAAFTNPGRAVFLQLVLRPSILARK